MLLRLIIRGITEMANDSPRRSTSAFWKRWPQCPHAAEGAGGGGRPFFAGAAEHAGWRHGVISGLHRRSRSCLRSAIPSQAIVRVRPLPAAAYRREADRGNARIHRMRQGDGRRLLHRPRLLCARWANSTGMLDKIAERAETNTSMIKSSPVKRRLPPFEILTAPCGACRRADRHPGSRAPR